MKEIAQQALHQWGLAGAECAFVAARENTIFNMSVCEHKND